MLPGEIVAMAHDSGRPPVQQLECPDVEFRASPEALSACRSRNADRRYNRHTMNNADLGVIFDMDGVLVDSYEPHFESWRSTVGRLGLEMTDRQFASTFGRTSREIINQLWGERHFTTEEMQRIDHDKESAYREILARRFPAMDGAAELLADLHASGFRLAIGSSGPPENVALVIRELQLEGRIEATVTGKDVTRGKPDPQVFLAAAGKLGLEPKLCLVIEDAPVGITAAHAAGMKCIGLNSTGHTREQLSAADLVVDSLRELSAARIASLIAGVTN